MISAVAKRKIKKELKRGGGSYVSVILAYLRANNIKNLRGEDFSESMIRHVMNMPVDHAILEKAIYDCFDRQVSKNKKEHARRMSILAKVK